MRKTINYLLVLLLANGLFSCQKIENKETVKSKENTAIPLEDAIKNLKSFLTQRDGITKSKTISFEDIQVLNAKDLPIKTKAEMSALPDTLLYLINFSDSSGFAVLAADTRLCGNIFCVTEEGNISSDDFIIASHYLLGYNEEYSNEQVIPTSIILSSVINSLNPESLVPADTSGLPDYGGGNYHKYGPFVKTKWSQRRINGERIFNTFTPNNAPAGCVVIATAQILLANNSFNVFYSEAGIPCYRDTLKKVANYQTPNYGGSVTAKYQAGVFAYSLGRPNHCNITYGEDEDSGSSGYATGAKRTFQNFGYSNVSIHMGFGSSNQTKATTLIRSGKPAYLDACREGVTEGHAWVLDGEWGNYYHINWGWNGKSDGYYTKGVFNTTSRRTHDYTYDDGSVNPDPKNYTWDYRLITYSL